LLRPATSFSVFVKMDGSAIEPEVTPKQKDANDGATQQIVGPEGNLEMVVGQEGGKPYWEKV
jgi:hypothetical protein